MLVVGDHPAQLESAVREALPLEVVVPSGGFGPTHDDRTVEMLAQAAGRGLSSIPRARAGDRGGLPGSRRTAPASVRGFEPGVLKQATIPEGALSLGLAGTAPGVLLQVGSTLTISLPGPPGELQRIWRNALERPELEELLSRAQSPEHRVLRFFGLPESAVARVMEGAGGEAGVLEATICAHDLEVQVDLVIPPGGEEQAERVTEALRDAHPRQLFAEDEEAVEAIVLRLARERGFKLGAAESCTGGLVSARLTSVPGASDVFLGGIVAYDNSVKTEELGVTPELLERHGAVSAETAASMASGARRSLSADVAVSVTGVAGPDGGTPEKPVGLVFLHAETPEISHGVELRLPGDRDAVRRRAAASALHLLRRVLTQSRDDRV